jgi:drug/metabolite transporter (DMT)-like permease
MWVLVGFFLAADWALVIVLNKRMLAFVHPVPLNLLLRIATLVGLVCMTVPLTAFGWWDLDFGLTAEAAGYIAISAVITWVVAFNAYYYALRAGRASVVAPITATDPIWAALFAPILLGAELDPLVIVGLVVATVGIVLIARWMSAEPGELLEAAAVPVVAVAAEGAGASGSHAGALGVVALSTIAAAGWGLGPVAIELAENANGGASASMMVGSQTLGALLLAGILLVRRSPLLVRPLAAERRRFLLLLLASGVLEAVFAVLYYLIIEAIGAVLTLLITATSPVFAILGGAILLREPVGRRLWIAAAVTIGGVVIATLARVA